MIDTDKTYISNTLIKRNPEAHKGNFGKILIFAGSLGMAGAAVLCGRSALKSGAGLVQFLLPDFQSPLLPILQTAVPEATCVEMSASLRFQDYTGIAAGSGLGKSQSSLTILTRILENYKGTLVLDADALNLAAENEDLAEKIRTFDGSIILTPHIGEARRLLHTNDSFRSVQSRIRAASALARQYHCIAVLKGAGTLVADGLHEARNEQTADAAACTSVDSGSFAVPIYQNTTGNPGMATAGSGDSLTGLIISLAAQGYAPVDAARMGVFFHGLAGDLAAKQLGEMGLTSSDIVSHIPFALKQYYDALL